MLIFGMAGVKKPTQRHTSALGLAVEALNKKGTSSTLYPIAQSSA
jgi:hypothetical protein